MLSLVANFAGSPRGVAADHHAQLDVRQVDALVEDAVGDHCAVGPRLQAVHDVGPLLLHTVAENARDQEPPGDLARHLVRAGEDDGLLAGVQPEDVLDHPQLLRRPVLYGLLGVAGPLDAAGLGVGAGLRAKVAPAVAGLLCAPSPP
jgi:hypothetical protein